MSLNFAYLAGGKLHLKLGDDPVRTIDSQFGQEVQDRTLKRQQRNAWKDKNPMAGMIPQAFLQQMEAMGEAKLPVAIRSVSPCSPGQLLYTLAVGDVTGVFTLDATQDQEQRLFHNSDFAVQHLNVHPQKDEFACTVMHKDGSANIAVMPIDGARPKEITAGDSIDLAPQWLSGAQKALVFQSAGIARNSEGFVLEQSPFSIEKLDFQSGEMTTVAESDQFDLLAPKMVADGSLYYIRRPYQARQKRLNILTLLKDILLMPFRLIQAIYEWLNVFTQTYTGKPLVKPGQPKIQAKQDLLIWGNIINTEAEAEKNRRFGDQDSPALVPRSWQLICQRSDGEVQVIGDGVISYDVDANGGVVYTNGSAIYATHPGGVPKRLLRDRPIEQVVLIADQ
ncbi:TolB-like translocation protein [Acaryochloris marina]|uniref:Uncharacterized protein n=1 Tax=Acaryochloris marina (strain MBIC 11017) TaxID=329726 RepID=B0CEW5_ACAM1|nr:hypothetical protein [Acaryochloris marina]ABW29362.1 hypothetical protein AM1_4383 [Acaryochloris marina MBIC11017]BDM78279.1 hypothetical protein AM10699_11490 [Acaryochloris marina MBIC10699]